nr:hypothetical protein [Tanacetum cinerariifolium]
MIVTGAENRPPMLEKTMYNSWQSRMLLHLKGNKNGRMMHDSIENGPLNYPTIEENGAIRPKIYAKLSEQEKLQDDCDVQVLNIILQGLPLDVYALVNHCQGHANEVRMMRKRYPDPLALVANYHTQSNSIQYPQHLSSMHQTTHSSQPYLSTYEAPHHSQQYPHAYQPQINHPTPSVPQKEYHSPPISQQPPAKFPQIESGLAVIVFLPGDDPIAYLNKAMATVVASRFPSTNNQLRTSFNPRNQATIQMAGSLFNKLKEDRVKVLMFSWPILSYDSDVLSEVPYSDTYQHEVIIQSVSEMPYFKQTLIVDSLDNRIINEDFGKRFVPQQELSTEQAFWLQTSNPNSKQLVVPQTPVKIEAPKELPKVSLVNTSLQKLKYHLVSFDKVMKQRTTPDAITEDSWGFEHTKAVFLTQIISFLNSLKALFKDFDQGLHDEITEVQMVFNQMKAVVEQSSIDKKCFVIQKKELF